MAHRLAPQARAELISIWTYIVKQGGDVAAADGVIDAITERFYLLSQYPRLGRARDDLRPGLRSFAVGEYVIVAAPLGASSGFTRPTRPRCRGNGCAGLIPSRGNFAK